MQGTRVAARYAKSFIDLTLDLGVLEQAYADMKSIAEVCKQNREFVVFLKSPVVKTDKKQAILSLLFNGKLNKTTEGFIQLITKKKREMYLEEIAIEFVNQYKEYKNIITAVVTSANGLDAITKTQIANIVKGNSQSEVMIQEEVNKSLIGGFIIRVGDKQVDASIARKLNNLKRSFAENPYVKEF